MGKRMTKKSVVILSAISLLLIAAAYIVKTNSNPKVTEEVASLPKVKVGFPIKSLDASPLILAYKNGYFRDEGIDVSLVHLQSPEGALAVGSGQVDIDITGASRLFGPIEKGAPIKMISLMSDMSSHLFIRPNSGIKNLKDLEGKKVSLGPAGSYRLKFKYIMDLEGVNIDKIKFIEMEKLYLPMALMDKKEIDAALIDEPAYVAKAKEQGAVVLPYWYEKNYQNTPSGSSVAVNTDFLKDNEENVIRFYKAMIRGHIYLRDNLEDSSVIVTKYIKENTNGAMDIKPEDFAKQVKDKAVRYIIWQDPAPIIDMARINYDLGLSERILTQDELYDLRFKTLLESAQREVYGPTTN
jgi:NitT/TauT family transport system substrate-binding protein